MDADRVELEALWTACALPLRRFLYRCIGDRDAADDLLGQTFLSAARAWRQFQGRGSREAWLFGIARNVARGAKRAQRLRRTLAIVEEPAAVDADDDSEELAAMRAAIAELPEPLRRTLQLRIADELTYEQIAAALGVPIGTVRSRLHDAVRRLRERMTRTGWITKKVSG